MQVHNVRLGFATNSSSTHSIIFLKPGQTVADSDVEAREFGWDHWTAASSSAKRQYVAFHLHPALYETQEGRFSMYIDAVEMKLGPSSFVEDIAMKRVKDLGEKTILSAFDTYGKTS
jgi:hypothetical protein